KRTAGAKGCPPSFSMAGLAVPVSGPVFEKANLVPVSPMHVLMTPPFHDEISHHASPDPERALAHVGSSTTLAAWVTTAAWMLKPRGTLTLIWRADGLLDVLPALAKAFGGPPVLPLPPNPPPPPTPTPFPPPH